MIDDPNSDSISTFFEAYGTVPPWDSRLLKILPNGLPVFEPTSLKPLEEESDKNQVESSENDAEKTDIELTNEGILKVSVNYSPDQMQLERRVKGITAPLDILRTSAEKYFIVMDSEVRATQMKKDPVFRNQRLWLECEVAKGEALRELVNLRELLTLSGMAAPTEKPQLHFHPSVSIRTPKAQWTELAVAVAKRGFMYLPLINLTRKFSPLYHKRSTDKALLSIGSSVRQQQRFMNVVENIKRLWKIQKIPYAPHVFEKGDDYPYRSELRIIFFSLPSACWGYDRPRRWEFPAHLGGSNEPLGQPVPPPFLCWPPLPSAPPAALAMAEVFFSIPEESDRSNDAELEVQIRWVGEVSHCIESKKLLNVKIIPTAIRFPNRVKGSMAQESSTETNSSTNNMQPIVLPSLLPRPVGMQSHWLPESARLHARLQAAQWHLVDRAIHLIHQAQAAKLKNILDVLAYGTEDGAQIASGILKEFEGLRSELPIRLAPVQTKNGSASTKSSPSLPQVTVERRIVVERWETNMTCVSLNNVPVYGGVVIDDLKSATTDSKESSPESQNASSISKTEKNNRLKPKFYVDLEVWVNYLSMEDQQNSNHCAPALQTMKLAANEEEKICLDEFFYRLPVLEANAVCFLRHLLLQAYRSTVRDMPTECFDLHHSTLPSTRCARGAKIFVSFMDWLEIMLASRMLLKNVACIQQEDLSTEITMGAIDG